MFDVPPAVPAEPVSFLTPVPPRGGVAIRVVCWTLILLVVIAALVVPLLRQRTKPVAPATLPEPREAQTLELKLAGRWLLGVQTIAQRAGAKTPVPANQVTAQLESVAKGPISRLRAVALIAELEGSAVAVDRLERLRSELPNDGLKQDAMALEEIYTAGADQLPAEARQRLLERHGWFASLALTHGLPTGNPAREAALAPAVRTVVALVLAIVGGLAAMGIGVVLLIVALALLAGGRLRVRYRPERPPERPAPTAFLEAFTVYLVVGLVLVPVVAVALGPGKGIGGIGRAWWLVVPAVLSLLWPRLRGKSWAQWREGLGWHRGQGVWREIGAGAVGYVAGLPVVAVGLVVTLILVRLMRAEPAHPAQEWAMLGGWATLVQLYLLACVQAPVFEESMFRGALYHDLRQRWGWFGSAVVSAVIFAAIHPQGLAALPVLGSLAFVFAALRQWRGSIIGPIAAHAINNGLALTLVALIGR